MYVDRWHLHRTEQNFLAFRDLRGIASNWQCWYDLINFWTFCDSEIVGWGGGRWAFTTSRVVASKTDQPPEFWVIKRIQFPGILWMRRGERGRYLVTRLTCSLDSSSFNHHYICDTWTYLAYLRFEYTKERERKVDPWQGILIHYSHNVKCVRDFFFNKSRAINARMIYAKVLRATPSEKPVERIFFF